MLAIQSDSDSHLVGILASTSTGVVTDDTWKCSRQYNTDWHLSSFNDAAWAPARVLGANDGSYADAVTTISPDAKWIWFYNTAYTGVYCRKKLC